MPSVYTNISGDEYELCIPTNAVETYITEAGIPKLVGMTSKDILSPYKDRITTRVSVETGKDESCYEYSEILDIFMDSFYAEKSKVQFIEEGSPAIELTLHNAVVRMFNEVLLTNDVATESFFNGLVDDEAAPTGKKYTVAMKGGRKSRRHRKLKRKTRKIRA